MKFKFILVALLMSLCAHAQTGQTVTSGQAVISGQTTAAAALPPAFAITTPSLANANSGQAYPGATIQTVNGVGAVSCNNPSGMPAGITINSACQVAGTSSSPGLYSFTVVATDTSTPTPRTASQPLSITVNCAGLSITSPPTLPSGTQASAYVYQLLKQGGVSPFNWSLASGSMPASCSIPSTGLISCTPSSNGTFHPNIQVVDSCPLGAQTSTLNATVVIAATPPPPPSLAISTGSTLPTGKIEQFYTFPLVATGGTPPYTWNVVSGSLLVPVSSSGVVSGTVEDLVSWLGMDSRKTTNHLSGTGNPHYDWLDADGIKTWNLKSSSMNPWDIWTYGTFGATNACPNDANGLPQICHWITENADENAFTNPRAYKRQLVPIPAMPRYFADGSTVQVDTAGPNTRQRTLNCELDGEPIGNLGQTRGITTGLTSLPWGGSVGTQPTLISDWFYTFSGGIPQAKEEYSFVKGSLAWGRVQWQHSSWNGSAYIPDNTTNTTTLSNGGATAPNFPCFGTTPSWIGGTPGAGGNALAPGSSTPAVTTTAIVRVTDSAANTVTKSFTLSFNPAAPPPPPPPPPSSIISNASCGKTPGGMDGPAHKPLLYVCSSEADTPRTGAVVSVPSGGNLQTAYNNAPCGADMQLAAGGVYTITTMTWSGKSCPGSQWIWIRTAPNANQPTEGNTQSPCNANVVSLVDYVPSPYTCPAPHAALATIVINPNGSWKIPGDHIRIENIELKKAAGTVVYNMLDLSSSSHIVVDRLWIHGNPSEEVSRGIFMDGASYVAVVDNFFSDIHCISAIGVGCDGQNMAATSAPGPFKSSHNFLSSGGEQIIFGGGGFATGVPSDIELTYNHTFRPCTWNPAGCRGVAYNGGVSGHAYTVKNQFEFKNAQRVWMRGNRFENNWGGFTQVGNNTTISPKNQASGTSSLCPQCLTKDIIEEFDFHLYFAQLFQVFNGGNANRAFAAEGNTYSFHDVLGIHARYTGCSGGCAPYLMELSTDPAAPVGFLMHDVRFNHVAIHTDTFTGQALMSLGGPPAPSTQQSNLVMENSIFPAGNYGIGSIGGTTQCAYQQTISIPMLAKCWFPLTFDHNGLPWGSGHGGNWVSLPNPPDTSIKIADQNAVNYANVGGDTVSDYALSPSSPFHNAGNDGKDLGPDITTLATEIAKTPY